MKVKFFLLLLVFPLSLFAQVKQVKAKITDAGSLYSTYDFDADEGSVKELIQSQGCQSLLWDIINYSHESNWPASINNFDTRMKNQSAIPKYNVYKIAANSQYTVLLVPAKENRHMDPNLRPARDIYFLFETAGVDFEGRANVPLAPEPVENVEADWDGENIESIQAFILNPGDVYSNFNLAANTSAKTIFLESGALQEEEFALLCDLVKEKSWPSGISTLDKRLKVPEEIKKYNAEFVSTFGEKDEYTLIWISPENNMHMPADMQPASEMGFYMVFKSVGISIY